MSPDLRVVVAHATSLFVIVPTSIRGAFAYHRAGLVEWRAVWPIGISSVLAAAGAAWLALLVPPQLLKVGIAMFLGAVLSVGWGAQLNQQLKPRALTLVFAAVFVLIGARLVFTNLGDLLTPGAIGM